MDLSPILNEFDAPFLVDSGTESYTESPIADEDSDHSGEFHPCPIAVADEPDCRPKVHLLDKDVSVDEDILAVPLQPTRTSSFETAAASPNELSSILRRESATPGAARKVSFPQEQADLAVYKEPQGVPDWTIHAFLPAEKILQIYQSSCKQHKTIELDVIKKLIMEIKNNKNHSAILNLSMLTITNEVNETLEDLLKVSNFRTLVMCNCEFTSETISEFLNMLEYYESICEIEVAMNFDEIAWMCFCTACSNICVLESISFKGMPINETAMRLLLNAIRSNPRITALKFDTCVLERLPSFYLVENLMTNTSLSELCLPSSGLYTKEADCLGRFLQRNYALKVLDISNNFIGDRGLEALAKGLVKQRIPGCGLNVLVIFNNQITEKSGPIIKNIIRECINLHTLNIGYNNLTDDAIADMVDSLEGTTSLEGLGLQCTLLTSKGMDFLANAIKNNHSLQKINLKGNKAIQVDGLEQLCQALTNSKITKIEIDETNRSSNDPQAYVQMVKKISGICTVNKTFRDVSNEDLTNASDLKSRKVSLSCEPRYIYPGPDAGSGDSVKVRPTKSRFYITKVQDPSSRPAASRFKVTRVIPSPEDEFSPGRFANVRSSVSSNDSVDSLQLDTDDGD